MNWVSQEKDPGKETAGKRSRPDRLPRPEELSKEGSLGREGNGLKTKHPASGRQSLALLRHLKS